jgi:hypothetical protein
MTAQAYNALTATSLGADKIIRATTMQSLYDNPTAIAQRGSGAPWNNGIGAMTVYTSGSGNFTVPDGVYRIKVTCVGGGGGGFGSGGSATNGGNTTFSTLTANGGVAGGSTTGGTGGTASGGDINMTGQAGGQYRTSADQFYQGGGDSSMGNGGRPGAAGSGYGAGGGGLVATAGNDVKGGGAGGTAIKIFTTTPGALLAYSVGAAGAGGTGAGAGTAGIIIIEY